MVQLGLFSFPREAEALYYRGGEVARSRLQRRPGCPAHEPMGPVKPSGLGLESPVRALLEARPGTLFLDRDVVTGLACACGRRRSLLLPRHRLNGAVRCRCGREMAPETVRRVSSGDPLAARPLKDLGIPPGHILEIVRNGRSTFVELGGGRG